MQPANTAIIFIGYQNDYFAENGILRGAIEESATTSEVLANSLALLEAVRRVGILARDSTPVRLAMSSEGLELVAITQDVGQARETLDADYTGSDLTVAFNPEYLVDGLEASPGDEIRLETIDSLKPAILRSTGDDQFLYLLMPVRVS